MQPEISEYTTQEKFTMVAAPILLVGLLVAIAVLVPKDTTGAALAITAIEQPENREDLFVGMSTGGKAVLVWDSTTETTLFAKNEEAQLPLASLTKLVTTHLAVTTLGANATVRIAAVDLASEGDSGLLVDEIWTVGDLAAFTLMSSSNDGAQALTRALYEKTNAPPERLYTAFAYNLGLSQTYFLNGTGLDTSETISGGYGSAKDVAVLLTYISQETPELLEHARIPSATFVSQSGFIHHATSTNELAATLPQLIGAKTGYTDLAGGNLAVLFEVAPNHSIAIVVLGSTREGRFQDVQALAKRTIEQFAQ